MSSFSAARLGFTAAAALVAAGLLLAGCGSASSTSSTPASNGSNSPASSPSGSGSSGSPSQSSSGGGIGSGMDTVLFPATVGNTWVYNDTLAGHTTATTTNMITAVTPNSAGERVMITTHSSINGVPSTPTTLTYQLNSDGSIQVPFAQVGNSQVTVKIKSGGIVWPSRAELDSGQPHTSTLTLQLNLAGHSYTVTAHVTVKGGGTESVTVPAGTYQATVVDQTISEHFAAITVVIDVTTWLADGVGAVKSVTSTKTAGLSQVVSTEVLKSFKQG